MDDIVIEESGPIQYSTEEQAPDDDNDYDDDDYMDDIAYDGDPLLLSDNEEGK